MIDTPGIYEISAEEYHADPCPEPSLSASIAHEMLANSPAHAFYAHPRLNPDFQREEKESFDLGTAAHAYMLQGESGFALVEAEDWRTKAARDTRDQARAVGKLPILAHRWQDILRMLEAANRQLDAHRERPRPFTAGKPEQTLIWREGAVWCRARPDWLHADFSAIDDYKTSAASANPEAWTRGPLYGFGADLQAAFYLRGLKALTGRDARFRFVVQENFAPFALSVVALGPMALVLAEKKVRFALEVWAASLKTGHWPAYPDRTCFADLPAWEEARWIAKEEASL